MKRLITRAIAAAIIVGLTSAAQAAGSDPSPDRFYITPMLTGAFSEPNAIQADDNFNGFQLNIGKNFGDYFALELYAFHFNDTQISRKFDSDSDLDITGYGASALFFPARDVLPIYGLIGGGFGTYDFDGVTPANKGDVKRPSGEHDSLFWDIGAGVIIPVTEYGVAIRAEYRYRMTDVDAPNAVHADEYEFQDHILSVGLQIPLGAPDEAPEPAPAPVQPVDSDGDGVSDANDQCPGTPAGVAVNANGCPVDSDGDGVNDAMDQCPGTPPGTPVNAQGCEKKQTVVLRGVTFEFDSAALTAQAETRLDNVIAALQASPGVKFRIEGHTDAIGSEAYNQDLSERRAQSVKEYLVSHGISASRITAVIGYGEARPVATNETAAGRAQNRRVELDVVSQ